MCVCLGLFVSLYVSGCIHEYMFGSVYTHKCLFMSVVVTLYACVCVYMYTCRQYRSECEWVCSIRMFHCVFCQASKMFLFLCVLQFQHDSSTCWMSLFDVYTFERLCVFCVFLSVCLCLCVSVVWILCLVYNTMSACFYTFTSQILFLCAWGGLLVNRSTHTYKYIVYLCVCVGVAADRASTYHRSLVMEKMFPQGQWAPVTSHEDSQKGRSRKTKHGWETTEWTEDKTA